MVRRDEVRHEGDGGARFRLSKSNESLQNHRSHFHRPTHNRPGRHCFTFTASCGTSAAASRRTQSSSRKARRNETGPSCRTSQCQRTHPNIRLLHFERSKSLINQPVCTVSSIQRSSTTISSS